MKTSTLLATTTIALTLSALAGPCRAAMVPVERALDGAIGFASAADFAGASLHLIDSTTYTAAAGDTFHSAFTFASPSFNVTVAADSHVAVSNIVTTPLAVDFDLQSLDGVPSTVAVALDRFANVGVTLTTGVSGALYALTVAHNPSGGVLDGFPLSVSYTMPGDWSGAGTGTGQHDLVALNAFWSIDEDFVFSGGVTTFSAHIASYANDGLHNPDLQFRLFGAAAPVPAPVTAALLGLGLAGLAFIRRYRGRISL